MSGKRKNNSYSKKNTYSSTIKNKATSGQVDQKLSMPEYKVEEKRDCYQPYDNNKSMRTFDSTVNKSFVSVEKSTSSSTIKNKTTSGQVDQKLSMPEYKVTEKKDSFQHYANNHNVVNTKNVKSIEKDASDSNQNYNATSKTETTLSSTIKNRVTSGQVDQKLNMFEKSVYDYYKSDSDNDGISDVNDVNTQDSLIQGHGDEEVIKKKKNQNKSNKPSETSKISSESKKDNFSKKEKKLNKKSEKIDKKLNKKSSKLLSKQKVSIKNANKNTNKLLKDVKELTDDTEENTSVQASKFISDKAQNRIKNNSNKLKKKRKVSKLQKKSSKIKVKLKTEEMLAKNKAYQKSKGMNKFYQKRRIKRSYNNRRKTRLTRNMKNNIRRIGKKAKSTGKVLVEIAKKLFTKIGLIIAACIIVFLMVNTLISSAFCAVTGTVSMASYHASDIEVTKVDNLYKRYEADLEYAISNIEEDYPGYDEYKYNIDPIGYDSYKLMSYLSVKYEEFTSSDGKIKNELNELFNEQYNYEITEIEKTVVIEEKSKDDSSEETDSDDNEEGENSEKKKDKEKKVETISILKVSLKSKKFEDVILTKLNEEEKEAYEMILETKGFFPCFPSPFDEEWINCVTDQFGYRVDPVNGDVGFHRGLDIGKVTGTELLAIFDGKVIKTGYDDSYGNYIIIEEKGTETTALYAHCSKLKKRKGDLIETGDVIAFVGSTGKSTGSHLHLEIKDSDGNRLNPYFYLMPFE